MPTHFALPKRKYSRPKINRKKERTRSFAVSGLKGSLSVAKGENKIMRLMLPITITQKSGNANLNKNVQREETVCIFMNINLQTKKDCLQKKQSCKGNIFIAELKISEAKVQARA